MPMRWFHKLLHSWPTPVRKPSDEGPGTPSASSFSSCSGSATATRRSPLKTLPWDSDATEVRTGEQLFESCRQCLPAIFAEVAREGRDPIVMCVDVTDLRWRRLINIVCEHPNDIYISPEIMTGQIVKSENVGGKVLYKVPCINGKQI